MITPVMQEDFNNILQEFREQLSTLSGKTILITGASGLIVSYLLDIISIHNQQLENPIKIIAITKNPITEDSRLSHLIKDKNISFITQDIGKPFNIPGKPNIIIHAASRANPSAFLEDPIGTIDSNINGTRTILEYAAKNPIEQFIFFSSAEIYGNPVAPFLPTPETYYGNVDCNHPFACYLESKRMAETLCMTFFRKHNVPAKILRILLAYGPGIKNDGKVISDFFYKLKENGEISLRDKGDARRSFCYISDTIRAILKIIFEGENGEAYNIGNEIETENLSIYQLAELVIKISEKNTLVKPNFDTPPKEIYGMNNRLLNINKLRSLGFSPKISLEEGLKRLRRYYLEAGFLK